MNIRVINDKDLEKISIEGKWDMPNAGTFVRTLLSALEKIAKNNKSVIEIHKDAILSLGIIVELGTIIKEKKVKYPNSLSEVIFLNKDLESIYKLVNDGLTSNKFASEEDIFLVKLGKGYFKFISELKKVIIFIYLILIETFNSICHFKTRLRYKETISQIDSCGVLAVPITALVTFLIGIVITYLLGNQLQYYGANLFVVDGIASSMTRELSPILVAIIVAGRSGSSFAAQLGSMRLNQEVEALEVMGLSANSILVIPRILALVIVMPILVIVGDIFGILGGMTIASLQLDVGVDNFIERLYQVLKLQNIYVGVSKAPFFAIFISSIGCRLGLSAEPNSFSIGNNTTSTVVQSIVSVILLNAIFAIIFTNLGI